MGSCALAVQEGSEGHDADSSHGYESPSEGLSSPEDQLAMERRCMELVRLLPRTGTHIVATSCTELHCPRLMQGNYLLRHRCQASRLALTSDCCMSTPCCLQSSAPPAAARFFALLSPDLARLVYSLLWQFKGDTVTLCTKLRACLGQDAALVLEALSEDVVYRASELHSRGGWLATHLPVLRSPGGLPSARTAAP